MKGKTNSDQQKANSWVLNVSWHHNCTGEKQMKAE